MMYGDASPHEYRQTLVESYLNHYSKEVEALDEASAMAAVSSSTNSVVAPTTDQSSQQQTQQPPAAAAAAQQPSTSSNFLAINSALSKRRGSPAGNENLSIFLLSKNKIADE